jgi:hypothetical protein
MSNIAKRVLQLKAERADICINEWNVEINGESLVKILNKEIGNSEESKFATFEAKITITIEEIPVSEKALTITNNSIKDDGNGEN